MISDSIVYAVSGCVYAVTLVALLARLRRISDRLYRYCYPVLFVVGLGAVTHLLVAGGGGTVSLGDRTVNFLTLTNDALAYPILWGLTALVAGVSRRMLAIVVGVPFVQVLAFQLGATAGGLLGLVSSVAVIAGQFVLLYLFWKPIWRTAQDLGDQRRLLFWKSRNLLWFLITMLVVYAFIALTGLFTSFGIRSIGVYISLLIRVGFAGFLFVNVDILDDGGNDDSADDDFLAPTDATSSGSSLT